MGSYLYTLSYNADASSGTIFSQIVESYALLRKFLQVHDFVFGCREFLEYQVKPFLKLWLNDSFLKNEIKKL
jgi:hypothetical protein